ncbi:filamentation induced by cAMP fic [Pyrrhoderma noxium]|uniref:Filamentation induced by cAMP fic n=1 Tax=Pyrrhoderma noxium TaxID=2282107 RepID=A0A286UJ47_9AGAM|nr:filamentation induced by cAMP fic [Pyrrhoderma noxium]
MFSGARYSTEQLRNVPHELLTNAIDHLLWNSIATSESTAELRNAALLMEDYLLPKYPSPFLMVRVGDVRAYLSSPTTALELYNQALDSLKSDNIKDRVFEEFVHQFSSYTTACVEKQWADVQTKIFIQEWRPSKTLKTPEFSPFPPITANQIRDEWARLLGAGNGDAWKKLVTLLSVETNQIEDAFLLTNASTYEIITHGVAQGQVLCMPDSVLKDEEIIRDILKDTIRAYENLHAFQEESGELTPDLILDTHRILMRSSKINPEFTKYLNTGLTRTRTRKWVYITSANFNVQCCPPDEVDKELEYICRIGKQWIRNWKRNPYAVAAWLQTALGSCHPFEDGNGRTIRLLASIPLLQQGYPPICVPKEYEIDYYAAIRKSYNGDLAPLADCFAKEQTLKHSYP